MHTPPSSTPRSSIAQSTAAALAAAALLAAIATAGCKAKRNADAPASAGPVLTGDTSTAAAPAPADPRVLDAERACTIDADCALVTEDCCPCTGLGRQTAVRKDKLEGVAARRAPVCSVIVCAQAMSDDPSCTSPRAVCASGRCEPELPKKNDGAVGGVKPIGGGD